MTRSRRSAKAAGTRFEGVIAAALRYALDDDRIERRARTGAKDRGDISGLRCHGKRLVVEVKDCSRTELAAWIAEAHREAAHDDALAGLIIHKRHGVADPLRQWVTCTVGDLVALLTGQPQKGRYE